MRNTKLLFGLSLGATLTATSSLAFASGGPHLRWGISAVGGPVFHADTSGVGGLNARLGVGFNDSFNVHVQPIFLLAAGVHENGVRTSGSAMAIAGAAGMAEVVFGRMFYLGAGPEFLRTDYAKAVLTSPATTSHEFDFSIAARGGLVLGVSSGLHIGIDFHAIMVPNNTVIMPLLAVGLETL